MHSANQKNVSNWYLMIEEHRRFIIFALVTVCSGILIVMSLRNPVDFDGYWHLQMGKDWLESGLSPYRDHYSFTYQNKKITGTPIFFQAALYTLVELFGEWAGFIILKLIAFFLTFACMLAWLKQIKAPTLAYCLVLPMLVILLELRAQVRPELISYSLSLVALMLYQRAQFRLSVSAIAPIVLLLLFWTNYHSPVLGYVIFFGLFIDIGLRLLKENTNARIWVVWAGWGLVLVLIGYLNPSLSHPIYRLLVFPDIWKTAISEYKSPLILYKSIESVYVLGLVAVLTLIMAVRQRKFGYLTCGLVMLYAGSTMARMVTPTGIVFLGMFAHILSDIKTKNALKSNRGLLSLIILIVFLGIFLTPLWDSVSYARHSMFSNYQLTAKFPKNLTSYMSENDKFGRIFNDYITGGYLIHRLSPNSQVYIDGRTDILYPVEHYQKYKLALTVSKAMAAEIDKYQIDFAVLNSSASNAILMSQVGELSLDFVDTNYALYSRESPGLPDTGRLWARPYCWTNDQWQKLSEEYHFAKLNLPLSAPILPLLEVAEIYASATHQKKLLSNLKSETLRHVDSKRFAGYRALEHGLNIIAIDLFSSIVEDIEIRDVKDYLALALAYARHDDAEQLEQTLNQAANQRWPRLEFVDLLIMQGLLKELDGPPFKYVDQAYVDSIFEQVGENGLSGNGKLISVQSFCP